MTPDPGSLPAAQTSGRTLMDHLEAYLARPDVVARLKPAAVLFAESLNVLGGMFLMTWTIMQRAVERAPSIAYEPLLIERGVKPGLARGLASLTISRANRAADERLKLAAVVRAFRFLAKPGRGKRAVIRRAEILLAAWEETSLINTIFVDAGLSTSEFIGLLKSVVEGRETGSGRITEIAATLAPHLSIPRGPKITVASASHEGLLELFASLKDSQAYTWDPAAEDFSDPLTMATRQEFGCPRFSPQSAHRRLSRRRAPQKACRSRAHRGAAGALQPVK